MQRNINKLNLPVAIANIVGSTKYNTIKGKVYFYHIKDGTLLKLEIDGLPKNNKNNFFGFHIHENMECQSERR